MSRRDYPHRSAIGNVQTDDMGDNLAIVLASDFEPRCESEELDDSETWKQEAIDKTNRVLDAIHAVYAPQINEAAALIASQAARIMELEEGLEPFGGVEQRHPQQTHIAVPVGWLQRARALSRKGGE